MLKLYNTLIRKKEVFKPLKKKQVGFYACGPTVYWFAHIGNLRTYIFEDILKRVLKYNGYKVKHVMNITDVGHLTSDADTGEDKMEKGAKRERKTVWQIAQFYTKAFKKDLESLNILPPDIWVKATDTIKDQIDLIKILEKKGFTYKIQDGVYFNTSKLKHYGALGEKKKRKLKAGARIKMVKGKKNLTDFALWKFTPFGVKRQMEWDSPWGKGFPGWHTECVVMSIKELGIPFDIHCGGIDHISIHHPNEIAQAKAAYGKIFARYWMHGEFLILKEGRMGKSEGNIITVESLIKKGFNPLTYRYLCLTAHYRSKLTFSWKDIKASQNALQGLRFIQTSFIGYKIKSSIVEKTKRKVEKFLKEIDKEFLKAINDDLNMPQALALMHKLFDYEKELDEKYLVNNEILLLFKDKVRKFDEIFGLRLGRVDSKISLSETLKLTFKIKPILVFSKSKKIKIPQEIKELVKKREEYREKSKFELADRIRKKIKNWIMRLKTQRKVQK